MRPGRILLAVCAVAGWVAAQADLDYLVVTPSHLVPAFDTFVVWRTRCGMRTTAVAVESVLVHAQGRDFPEKLRNFIRSYHESLGTRWVLLGGGSELVPVRMAYTPGNLTDYSPCDLYYSDLDGTWDADGDGIFGEESDSVDFHADVFVGRAPVVSAAQVQSLTDKWRRFEQEPAPDYLARLLEAGDTANLGPPPGWFVAKLMPPVGRYDFRDSLEAGFQLVWHVGHATRTQLVLGTQTILDTFDARSLQNRDRLAVLNSTGSEVAAFDGNCIGSCLVDNPDGGCAAVLGNSRAGWVACRELYAWFYVSLFGADTLHALGENHARTKDRFVPLARTNRYWRQSLYVWTLLGDPGLRLWTDTARLLEVNHSAVLDTGLQDFVITFRSGGAPCLGLVCLWKGNEVYERRWLDGGGSIPIHPRTPGEMLVTVTAPNHPAYLGYCGFATALTDSPPTQPGRAFSTILRGVLRLEVGSRQHTAYRTELLDISGRSVMTLRAGLNDVSHLAPGVYFVRPAGDCRQFPVSRVVLTR